MPTQTDTSFVVKSSSPLFQQLLLALLFAGLLSIAFLDSKQYYLTWFAFVPLLFALENASPIKTYLLGLVAGLACYVGGMYWIVDFIIISKGYSLGSSLLFASVYWLYCAHLIAFLMLLFRWLKKRTQVHEFLLFPIVVTTFTSSFPMLFSMRLGESQVSFPSALQAIEITGVHGLDAIIALFNIVVFRFLYQQIFSNSSSNNTSKLPWLIAVSVISLWLVYGVTQYSFWESKINTWDTLKVGIVQPNETPTLGKKKIYPGYTLAYPPEMEMTKRLNHLGAEIVIWPEAQSKGYLDDNNIRKAYQKTIRNLGVNLVFQDMQHVKNPLNGEVKTQINTALMLDGLGNQVGRYIKMKRIPFGEYVPFTGDDSFIKKWVEHIFGDFLIETAQGTSHKVFAHEKVNIIPLICYETTSSRFVGSAVNQTKAQIKKSVGSLLVALSNDGWFGSTHQPYQHIMPSVLRAVENRLPLIHVVNNGPSIVVTPSGKRIFISDFQQAAGIIVEVPHANTTQGSFYSKYPKAFDKLLYFAMALFIFLAIRAIIRERKYAKQTS